MGCLTGCRMWALVAMVPGYVGLPPGGVCVMLLHLQ